MQTSPARILIFVNSTGRVCQSSLKVFLSTKPLCEFDREGDCLYFSSVSVLVICHLLWSPPPPPGSKMNRRQNLSRFAGACRTNVTGSARWSEAGRSGQHGSHHHGRLYQSVPPLPLKTLVWNVATTISIFCIDPAHLGIYFRNKFIRHIATKIHVLFRIFLKQRH